MHNSALLKLHYMTLLYVRVLHVYHFDFENKFTTAVLRLHGYRFRLDVNWVRMQI